MPSYSVLGARASVAGTHGTPLIAAILASDAASPSGFRVSDVRFFFLLFTNWMEDDLLRPGVDLDLTQVRRVLAHLVSTGRATVAAGRHPPYQLNTEGVLALVDALTDLHTPRSFEEVILLVTIAASYRQIVADRVRGGPRAPELRVLAQLDPAQILVHERVRIERALRDVEARIEASGEMARRVAASPGVAPQLLAERLEAERKSYQLQPMRGLAELVRGLPPKIATFELGEGLSLRGRAMFTPLAEQLRARLQILDRLAEVVRGEGR